MSGSLVWSYGGGVQSAAIAVAILRGDLPRPDLAVMADTGREASSTWRYLIEVVEPALDTIGLPITVISHDASRVDLYADTGELLIPAWTTRSGSLGRLPAYCSSEWKRDVVRRWLRGQGVAACDLWLGISTDEAHRMKPSGKAWITHRWPLIDLRWSRAQCVVEVESVGWPTPPKSRCWMCPHMSRQDWQGIRASEDWPAAVALDDDIRQADPDVYVHRAGIPLGEAVALDDDQPTLFDACDGGWCWT